MLDEEHARSGADYVGEWHSHIIDLPEPSRGDMQTLAQIILDADYEFPSFSMLLAVVRQDVPEIRCYVTTAEKVSDDTGQRPRATVYIDQVTPEVVADIVAESH